MSGLIYNQTVKSDITPEAPDFKPQQVIQQGVQNIQDIAQQQKEFEFKVKVKEAQYLANTVKNEALSIYDSATKAHGNDITKWNEFVDKNIKGVFEKIPDDNYRAKLMAELQISTASTKANVQKNTIDLFNKKNNQMQVDGDMRMIAPSITGLASIFNGNDKSISPIQRKETAYLFQDGLMNIKNIYDKRDALDDNGNHIYSDSERNKIVDAYENAGVYAIVEYAGMNVGTNRKGVVNTYEYLKANKAQIMKDYGMETKKFDQAVVYMEKILKGETTAEQITTESSHKLEIKTLKIDKQDMVKEEANIELQIEPLGITKSAGELDVNSKTKKIDVFNAIVRLEDSYSQKKVSDSFYKSNIVKLKSAYWDMESKPLYQKKGWGIFAQDTVGTSMVKKINDLSSGLSDSTGANAVRFDATVIANNVLKGIGIDANSTNPVDIGNYNTALQKEMPKIIRKIYPEQVKNLTDDQIKANQIKILADIKSKKNLGTVKAFTNKESSLDKEDWSK